VSRLKSAPAPKRTATARSSAPAAGRGVYVQAPKSDIFVVMLAISLGAILIGCLLLTLVMNRYDFKIKPTAMNAVSAPVMALAEIPGNPEFPTTVRL